MKRLSATQKLIEGLAPRVPSLTASQKDWAMKNVNYFAIRKEFVRCPSCTHAIDTTQAKKVKSKWCSTDTTIVCPHCGAKIQLRQPYMASNQRQRSHQDDFFQIMNVVGDWQVTRLFYMQRYCYVNKPSTDWEFFEVCQAWNRPDLATTYFRAFPKKVFSNYQFNPYSLYGSRALTDEEGHYRYDEQGYYLFETFPNTLEPRKVGGANYFDTTMIYPKARILPQYKKMGLDAKTIRALAKNHHNVMWLMEAFSPKNYKPMYETLVKAKAYEVFDKVTTYREHADEYFTAWKIATRNGYNYKRNKTEWYDCIDLLRELGMDYRNPHYVCPADLHAMHQHLLKLSNRKKELEELKRKENEDKQLRKRVAKYLDMEISNKHFDIIVLPNVKAFKDEGDHLGHCVYRCEYYSKPNSLILSARDKEGHRVETIEVYLDKLTINQCYGYGDTHTKWHKEIVNLMNENMWQVRERRDAKRMQRAS